VSGINWNVRLMALKFLDADGYGYVSDAVECINYAMQMKASGVNVRAINASWGGPGLSESLQTAIEAAGQAEDLFVAAAGNNGDGSYETGTDNDLFPLYPASFDLANVISVAAVDRQGNLAGFSNYGATSVHLAAPGVSIASTVPFDGYAWASGTSMATPHVSGVIAFLLSVKSGLSADELRTAVLQSASPLPSLDGKTVTGGLLNAANAVKLVQDDEPPLPASSFGVAMTFVPTAIIVGESVTFGVAVGSVNGFNDSVALTSSVTPDPGGVAWSWSQNPVSVPAEGVAKSVLTLSTSPTTLPGTYSLSISGLSGENLHVVTVTISIEPSMEEVEPPDSGPRGLMFQPNLGLGKPR
jgi:subtilisin family serine protease